METSSVRIDFEGQHVIQLNSAVAYTAGPPVRIDFEEAIRFQVSLRHLIRQVLQSGSILKVHM